MDPVTRRKFIQTTSVAAVGAALAGPAVLAASKDRSDRPAESGSATAAVASAGVPEHVEDASADAVVAHVRDGASGEISVFVGTREVIIWDRDVAARLLAATR